MTIQVYVSAEDKGDKLVVSDHYEFATAPRVGEEVVIDQDGQQFLLLVKSVVNFAKTKGDFMNEVSPVHIGCDLIRKIAR